MMLRLIIRICLLLIYWFSGKSPFFKNNLRCMFFFTINNNRLISIVFLFNKNLTSQDRRLSLFLNLVAVFEIIKLFKILLNIVNLLISHFVLMIIVLFIVIIKMVWRFINLIMWSSVIIRISILFFIKIIFGSLCFKLGIYNFNWNNITLLFLLILYILHWIVHFVFVSILVQWSFIFLRFITIILCRFQLCLVVCIG
jgi:hypothetical protein